MEKTDDGITLTENADYRTFTCELDNYNLYLNNNSLNTAPTPDTATIDVTIDGVKIAETVINVNRRMSYTNVKKILVDHDESLIEAVEKTFPLIEQLRNEGIIITEFEYVNALQIR